MKHYAKIVAISALISILGANLASSATISQATVATDLLSQTFDFEIVWNSSPNFLTTDSFKYNILDPTTASSCCSPYSGWSGFASANSDYQLIEQANVVSLYSGSDQGRTFIGTIPFTLTSNVLDFTIAFSLLNEPNGLVYELEHYVSDAWDGNVLVGSADGIPATVPGVPLPSTLPLLAFGLGALGLLGWYSEQKKAQGSRLLR